MTARQWYARFRALWRGPRPESELDEEIAFHLAEEADERVAAGLTPAEARLAARKDFGSVAQVRETTRDVWRWGAMERLLQDVRYGVRALKAAPVVSIVAILSLALGIGANTAIFSVLDSLLLRSLPVRDPQQLVLLQGGGTPARTSFTNPLWEQIRDRQFLFDGAFAASSTRFDLARGGESDVVEGLCASGRLFEVLGVPAILGRTFTEADDRRGGGPDGPVAVISYRFWQRRFGGAADAIGRSITVERVPFTIIGVAPPEFFGIDVGRAFDVAIPIGTEPLIHRDESMLDSRSSWWLRIMIRLKADQPIAAADAILQTAAPQMHAATLPHGWKPQRYLPGGITLVPAASGGSSLRDRYRRPLATIMIVASLVLLIACANLANLLLARATARRPEMSLRLALGAPRARIARQLLTESLVLSSAGALLGLFFARLTSDLLVRQISTATDPVFLPLSLNWRILGFAAAAAIATAVLFGTAPALRGTRAQPNDALKAQGRAASSDGRSLVGQALVVLQVALSLVLIVGAGLFLRTVSALAALPLGFDSSRVLIANVTLPAARIPQEQRAVLFDRLLEAASRVPGVASAALSEMTPIAGHVWNQGIELPAGPPVPHDAPLTYFNVLSPGWFETYGTPLIAGRDFTTADAHGAPLVAIANETFARTFLAGRNPIGIHVRTPGDAGQPPSPSWLIVGYVKDAVYESLRDPVPPTLYLPIAQRDAQGPEMSVSVSVGAGNGSPVRLTKALAAALTQVHGDIAITFRPLADQVDATLTQERVVATLSTFFGGLALLLAGVGVYGVTAYAVSRRRTEIGVRLALGASPSGVIALVLRRVALLVIVGTILGAAVSLWASTLVSTLLFGLEPRDTMTLGAAIFVLAAVGTLAGWLPALRASRIDPARVLRDG